MQVKRGLPLDKRAAMLRVIAKENMNAEKDSTVSFPRLINAIPSWFAVFIGLTYGTGFLCVFTFLDNFGIREAGEDFFRVKYIHVGILFLLFPICILIPLTLSLSLRRILKKVNSPDSQQKGIRESDVNGGSPQQQEAKESFDFPISSFVLFLNMFVAFYIYVVFAPRSFVFTKEFVL